MSMMNKMSALRTVAAAMAVAATVSTAFAAEPVPRWGKTLRASYDIDGAIVEAYARHKASKKDAHESAIVNAMMADTVDWLGPALPLEPDGNPYRVVVSVTGTAPGDGDATSLWQAGWRVADNESRVAPLAGLNRQGLKAGERFTVTAATGPLSFKAGGARQPEVNLVQATNLRIESVHVEVWQGLAPTNWLEQLMSFKLLLVGLAMVPLGWWARRGLRTGF